MFALMSQIAKGIITSFCGAIADIPAGWALCDGSNGTRDLRDAFIVGAGTSYAVAATGGESSHTHLDNFVIGDPSNWMEVNSGIGEDVPSEFHNHIITGSVTAKSTLPPYFALAFIMKL